VTMRPESTPSPEAFRDRFLCHLRYGRGLELRQARPAGGARSGGSAGAGGATPCAFAMDLAQLVADPSLDVASYTTVLMDRMRADVADRIARLSRGA